MIFFDSIIKVFSQTPLNRCRIGLFIFIAFALNSDAQNANNDAIRVDTRLVHLNIGVSDAKGNPVTNLTREDLLVFEDDVPQTILNFEPTTAPFSLVLLLDTSGSTLGFRQQLKFAAARFVDALAPENRVAVVSFNTKTELLANFTTDRRKIAFAIEVANGRNETRLYSALQYASKLLAGEGKRRKAIVVLTDGIDSNLRNDDRLAVADAKTETEALASIKPEQSKALRRVLEDVSTHGITIYPLVLPSGDPKRLADPTLQQVAFYLAAGERVKMLADGSGGRVHIINRLEDMGRLYAEVASDLRTLYSLSYQSSVEKSNRSDGWRTIRIYTKRPELVARTRPGYFGGY